MLYQNMQNFLRAKWIQRLELEPILWQIEISNVPAVECNVLVNFESDGALITVFIEMYLHNFWGLISS